jgi:long-chain acyl-CoA synthetase
MELSRPATYVPMPVSDAVRAASGRAGAKAALIEGDRALTYTALVSRMERFTSAVTGGLGLGPGDNVGLLSPNCIEYFEAVLGLAGAGVATVHLSTKATSSEVALLCAHAEVRAVFVHESLIEVVRDAGLPDSVTTVVVGGDGYESWLAQGHVGAATRPVDEWETFCIFYTSGTTGAPKGVLVPHRSRMGNFFGMATEYGCFGPTDTALSVAPMCHGAGLAFALAPLVFGGSTRVHAKFDPELVVADLAEHDVTNVFVVPTHLHALLDLPPRLLAQRPRALRAIISNSAPLDHPLKERTIEHFGPGLLFECYGSTEASIVTNIRPEDQLRKPGSVGHPFVCTEVRLLDDAGVEVPTGSVGELHSRSPFLFNGYWKVPIEDTPGWREGWFSAGDLARRDDEGFISVVGRKDDSIITGGINVYPREIELALLAHPAVAEAAVYGVDDARWGQAVVASVQLHDGVETSPTDLIGHCKQRLSAYKIPKSVSFVAEMPRNATGKILRRELRARGLHREG